MTRKITVITSIIFFFYLPYIGAQQAVHTVVRGDTLYSISRRYDISVQDLRMLNNIDEDGRIYIGQNLKLSVLDAGQYQTYRVERGDTLFGLARRFDTSVAEIRKLNSLDSDMLKIGQELRILSISSQSTGASIASSSDAEIIDSHEPTDDAADTTVREATSVSPDTRWPHNGSRVHSNGKFPGVFISGEQGDDILSVSSGRVIYSGPHSAFGHVVFVQSSQGYIYVYGGNASTKVNVGDAVHPGTVVGSIGMNPLTREQAVFFSIWKNNEFLPPDSAPRT